MISDMFVVFPCFEGADEQMMVHNLPLAAYYKAFCPFLRLINC